MNKVYISRILVLLMIFISMSTLANSINDTNSSFNDTISLNATLNITPIQENASENISVNIINVTTSEEIDETIQKVKDSIRVVKTSETPESITFSYVGITLEQPIFRIISERIRYGIGNEVSIPSNFVNENTTIEIYDKVKLVISDNYNDVELEIIDESRGDEIETNATTIVNETTTKTNIENKTSVSKEEKDSKDNKQKQKKEKKQIYINSSSEYYYLEGPSNFIINLDELASEIIKRNSKKEIIHVGSKIIDSKGNEYALESKRVEDSINASTNKSLSAGSYTLVSSLYYNKKSYIHNIPLLVNAIKTSNNTLRVFNTSYNTSIASLENSVGEIINIEETIINRTTTKIIPLQGSITSLIINSKDILDIDTDHIGIDTHITNLTGPTQEVFTQAYAIDPEQSNITTIDITATAKGDKLYKCVSWNFTTQTCYGEWTFIQSITPGEEYRVTIDKVDPAFGELSTYLKTEWGEVTSLGDTWTVVNLVNSYTNPVILATPHYTTVGVSTVPRITNITSTSFEIRLQDTGGGIATSRDTSYFVIEEGTWTLPDGTAVEAFTYTSTQTDSDSDWTPIQQSPTTTFTNPIVLGQVMSYNDIQWSVFWSSDGSQAGDPTPANIYTGKHVGQDPSTTRNDEEMGVVIFEQDSGNLSNIEYAVYKASDSIQGITNSPPYTVNHLITFSSVPSIGIASSQGMDGANGGWPVFYNAMSTSQASMAIDEYDSGERSHTSAPAGILAFASAGSYSGNKAPQFINPSFNESIVEPEVPVTFIVNITDSEDNLSVAYTQASFTYPNGTSFDINITQTTIGTPIQTGDIENSINSYNGLLAPQIGETGRVTDVSSWQTINLEKSYVDPVVFVFGQDKFSRGKAQEQAIAIVTNITSSSFEVANINASDLFIADDVGYVVLEKGVWTIGGSTVQVGEWNYSGTAFVTKNFNQTFASTPTVYIQIQNNSNNWYTGRYTESSLGVSSVDIQYEDESDTFSETARVGYLAFEQGTNNDFFAGDLELNVADDPGSGTFTTVNFPQTYNNPIFMGIIAEGGGDPTTLGINTLTSSSVGIRPTEETESDDEQNHATNDILWMVFNNSLSLENTTYNGEEDSTLGEVLYENIDTSGLSFISSIKVTITVDSYDTSASTQLANAPAELDIALGTTSGYQSIGSIIGAGNMTRTGSEQVITTDWASDETLRDIRIRATNMDYYNETTYDTIIWSNVYVSIQAGNRTVEWTYEFSDTASVGTYNLTQLESNDGILTNTTSYNDISFIVLDQTPPTITDMYNITLGNTQALIADFDATDYSGISEWNVNNSLFNMNEEGEIRNTSVLAIGIYLLNITVNDTYNNFVYEVIQINVTDTPDITNPLFEPSLTLITVPYANSWTYDINATDDRGIISEYWINDTSYFIIDSENGILNNKSIIPLGVYSINVSVNDSSDNMNTSTLQVNVSDLTPPQFTINSPLIIEYGTSFAQQLDISDNVEIDTISINDTNFTINNTGHMRNTTLVSRGTYNVSVVANDTSSNQNSAHFLISVVDTTPPSNITNLASPAQGYTWIYWNWSAPNEADLNTYIIYLDDVFYANSTEKEINISGLLASTSHQISIQTADADENINNTNVSDTTSTLIDTIPLIDIESPLNLSASLDTFRLLNFTITDQEDTTLCVQVTGSQSSPISKQHIIYDTCSYANNTAISYNWSRPVLENITSTEVLWHFDNITAYGEDDTTIHDFAGGIDHPLTCTGSACPTYIASGAIGGAFNYNSANAQAWTITEQFFNDAFTTRSYQLWFKADSTSGTRYLYEEGGSTNGIAFKIESDTLQAAVRTSSTQFTLNAPFTDTTQWHFLVVQYDSGNFSMFLDGVLVDTIDTSGSYSTISAHSDEGYVGGSTGGGAFGTDSGTFEGAIDEFRIIETAFSESEILNLSEFATNTTYYWNIEVSDRSQTTNKEVQFLVQAPTADLSIVNITMPQSIEGVNTTVFAFINNTGTTSETNTKIEFLINNDISINKTIDAIDPGEVISVNVSYLFTLGETPINVSVDADNSIVEVDETNNNISSSISVSSWHTLYGSLLLNTTLTNSDNNSVYSWFNTEATGILYVVDSEASINFANIYALGQNTSNENSTNDFVEADIALGLTGRFDSINSRFATTNDVAAEVRDFTINEQIIVNVPIINSTNSTIFKTGIMWDATSDTTGQYDENEVLIFITNVENKLPGSYGIYDYEISIPTSLEDSIGASEGLDIYVELE